MAPVRDEFQAGVTVTGGNNLSRWLRGLGLFGGGAGLAIVVVMLTPHPPKATVVVTPFEDTPQIKALLARAAEDGASRALSTFNERLGVIEARITALDRLYGAQQTQINTFDATYKTQVIEFNKQVSEVKSACSNIDGRLDTLVKFLIPIPKGVQ
jgi:hypothetical protein